MKCNKLLLVSKYRLARDVFSKTLITNILRKESFSGFTYFPLGLLGFPRNLQRDNSSLTSTLKGKRKGLKKKKRKEKKNENNSHSCWNLNFNCF